MSESGKAIIVTAPSGSGKTTIVKQLLNNVPELAFSISATTRPKREGEVNGRDYYFFSAEEFDQHIDNGDFIEWEEVYPGKRYGTLKQDVIRLWSEGKCVIFDVEVKGAMNLKKYFAEQALAIFIRVPSLEVLEERLRNRRTESEESIRERLGRTAYEMSFEKHFDRTVINDQLEDAVAGVTGAVRDFIEAS